MPLGLFLSKNILNKSKPLYLNAVFYFLTKVKKEVAAARVK